ARAGIPDDLPAVEQPHNPRRSQGAHERKRGGVRAVVAVDACAWDCVPGWNRGRGASPDLRRGPDCPDESVRHDLLLSRRPARDPRDGRPRGARAYLGPGALWVSHTARCLAERSLLALLAFRGCRVGGRVLSRVRDRTMTPPSRPDVVRRAAPSAWPIVLAFGVTLIFAGLVTSVSVSTLGVLLFVPAAVGWFREVLPEEAHETVRVARTAEALRSPRRTVAHYDVIAQLPRAWLPL